MDSSERITRKSSYDTDGPIAKAFCKWVLPFYYLCQRKKLEIEDLYKCSRDDESQVVVQQLQNNWENELNLKHPNFCNALIKTFAFKFYVPFLLFFIEDCIIKTIQPILLGVIVRYFSDTKHECNFGVTCMAAAGLCFTSFCAINCQHPAYISVGRISMKAKIAWCTLIYKKCLKLNRNSLEGTSVGQIVNLMTNDIRRFDEFSIVVSYLIIVPIQMVIFICIAWKYLGVSCLATVVGLIFFVPILALVGRKINKLRMETSQLTDNRIGLVNEIIRAMRVIKMYAWETHFSKLGHEARKKEMIKIRYASIMKGITLSVSFVSARLVMFLSFITFVLMGGTLNAETIFVSIALFERLRYSLTWMFPQAVAAANEILVSCKRIQHFLSLEEVKPIKIKSCNSFSKSKKNSVVVKCLSAYVNNITSNNEFKLKSISFSLKYGELMAIVGPVGSGKSALLLALLGELNSINADEFMMNGTIGYVGQESYCFNATIKQNILFGLPFNRDFYKKILKICALEDDFKQLDNGDQTLVGERGVTLSGGQKARINLARSLYQNRDIYLFDDPLSAVDVSVAKHIFEKYERIATLLSPDTHYKILCYLSLKLLPVLETIALNEICILDYLKDKTVILVTHQMQFIRNAAIILYLCDGESKAIGNYYQLEAQGIDFLTIMNNEQSTCEHIEIENPKYSSCILSHGLNEFKNKIEFESEKCEMKIEDELDDSGRLSVELFVDYFKSGSGPLLVLSAFVTIIATQFLFHFSDFWLTYFDSEDLNKTRHIVIYALISIALFLMATLRSVSFFQICLNASEMFHNRVFDRLLSAQINVYDSTPIGRILSRFTRDIGILDDTLPMSLFDLNLACVQLLGIFVVVITVSSYLIIPALAFMSVLFIVRKYYVKPSQEMRKFEAITRSPIYSHLSTTIDGLTTIRAFNAQQIFLKQYYRYQNDHTSCWFLQCCVARAFGIVLDYIGFAYITIVVITLLYYSEEVSGKAVGLAFASIITLTGMTQWAVKRSVDMEIWMTSVQRLLQYCKLPKEEEESNPEIVKPPHNWPSSGDILIKNMSMSYPNSNQFVLNNINIEVKNGEKVGIVGRTGAGKSSLINALFRLCESSGQIIIDGIDIKTIKLHDLRQKLSIIPQDPIAFSGSLRRNLDPFDGHSEQELWTVLEEVQLKHLVESFPDKLNTIVCSNASNLSVGQRQLICLARAILRKNVILLLDEATASVDHQTDTLIQKAIKSKFSNCTVITVAHRIDTIIDCDRVLVMSDGHIVEHDSPYLLLNNNNSYFAQLVRQTGRDMASHLYKCAQTAHNCKNIKLPQIENIVVKSNNNVLRQRNVI